MHGYSHFAADIHLLHNNGFQSLQRCDVAMMLSVKFGRIDFRQAYAPSHLIVTIVFASRVTFDSKCFTQFTSSEDRHIDKSQT